MKILLGLFMIFGGIQHFVKLDFYLPFVPAFLPFPMFIVYASALIEIIPGIVLLLSKKYAKYGAVAIMFLMIIFLPIHIWDVFSDTPAVGSHTAALIRLPMQFVLIALAWKIQKVLFANTKTI